MSAVAETLSKLTEWMASTAATELFGCFVVFIAFKLLGRLRKGAHLGRSYLIKTLGRPQRLRRLARGVRRRHLLKMRRYRFDLAWIQREVSRGHVSLTLCVLWVGMWVLAMGLMDILNYTGEPLRRTSTAALFTVLPAYFFEIDWIIHSGNAAQVIKHRQEKRVWRYAFGRSSTAARVCASSGLHRRCVQ